MKHGVTSGPLAYQVTLIYEALFLIMPVISFVWSRKSKWRPKNGFGFYLKPEETIRNYVMHPYKLVKDVRTSEETGNVEAVMNGDLNAFLKSFFEVYEVASGILM